jgi:hypothetical protein
MYLNEYFKGVAYHKAQDALAQHALSLKLAHWQSHAALNMGVALTLHIRAARQGPPAASFAYRFPLMPTSESFAPTSPST